jgi:pimeloyl-ACP methyl ester carboxylesterase
MSETENLPKDVVQEFQVSWPVDEIEVYATLTVPAGDGPFPAAVMVAGSGPTDRNWCTPLIPGANGSAALLAQVLTNDGFVTLRYDKRASGPHVQENMKRLAGKISMQGHLDELTGGVHFLAARPDVDARRLFALTNSEGCIHALNYQLQAKDLPFAGLVLTAPPARPIGVVARSQIAAQVSAIPGGESILAGYDAAIEDFSAGRPVKVDEKMPKGMRDMIMAVSAPINQPFSRELWVIDAAVLLAKIAVPVLVVIGKKDLQVDWQSDGPVIEDLALAHDNIRLIYLENANHVLKYEPRPRSELNPAVIAESYNAQDAKLDPQAVQVILSWLNARR